MSDRDAIIELLNGNRLENADVLFILDRQCGHLPAAAVLGKSGSWLVSVTYPNGSTCVWVGGTAEQVAALVLELPSDRKYTFMLRPSQLEPISRALSNRWQVRPAGAGFFYAAKPSEIAEPPASAWTGAMRELSAADLKLLPAYPDDKVRDFAERIQRGWARAAGCFQGGGLVAFLAIVPYIQGIAEVSWIHTLPNWRRKGIATDLLRWGITRLVKPEEHLGYSVASENIASVATCRRAGMRLVVTTHEVEAEPRRA
jgi:ribosomal protein S18 acetylase RimI-like enzyme